MGYILRSVDLILFFVVIFNLPSSNGIFIYFLFTTPPRQLFFQQASSFLLLKVVAPCWVLCNSQLSLDLLKVLVRRTTTQFRWTQEVIVLVTQSYGILERLSIHAVFMASLFFLLSCAHILFHMYSAHVAYFSQQLRIHAAMIDQLFYIQYTAFLLSFIRSITKSRCHRSYVSKSSKCYAARLNLFQEPFYCCKHNITSFIGVRSMLFRTYQIA